ncbi:MAG: ComEC/Rec2 family competence protein [Acidimicrobiia bacterium]
MPTPVGLAAAGALAAWRLRRPLLLCAAVGLLVSGLGARALAGLDGAPDGPVRGLVQLVGDPEPVGDAVRAEGRLGRHRVELWAGGSARPALGALLAGDRARIRGLARPAERSGHQVARHLSARVEVWTVDPVGTPAGPHRWANAVRRTLAEGAATLPVERRALFTGLVVGDDRGQPVVLADDFRAAGLSHLLAVSGSNLVVALAVADPVLRRLRLGPRMVAALVVVGMFCLVTRFEPSVMRAGAVAAAGVAARTAGRPVARLRLLALVVTGLLVVDPLLARSVGFRLSVGASAGIVVAAGPLSGALPGPRRLAEPLAVTLAAQLGVAPILLATFGPLPVASVPANLLAVPLAGFVTAWGLVGGLVAGLAGGPVARAAMLPVDVALRLLAAVARAGAIAPLGRVGPWHVAAIGVGLAVRARPGCRDDPDRPASRPRHAPRPPAALVAGAPAAPEAAGRGRRRVAGGLVVAAVASAVLAAQAPPPLRVAPVPGLAVWRAGGRTLVVVGDGAAGRPPSAPATLVALREAGVRRLDVLVLARPGLDRVAEALADRYHPPRVLGPRLDRTVHLQLGPRALVVVPAGGRLVDEADGPRPRAEGSSRGRRTFTGPGARSRPERPP